MRRTSFSLKEMKQVTSREDQPRREDTLRREENNSLRKERSSTLISLEDTREVFRRKIWETSEKISREVLWDHQELSTILINTELRLRHRLLNKKSISMILFSSPTIKTILNGNKQEDGQDLSRPSTITTSN